MTTEAWIVVLLVALAAVGLAVYFATASRRAERRHQHLRQRFGPEYDRALEDFGSSERAASALAAREKRVRAFKLRPLSAADHGQFLNQWRAVQARFVDDPSRAVQEANELIKTVMHARGYPVDDFDQRVADLSVDHGNVVQHYRAARALADANREGRANTEELRQAFVHYRALFADLLVEPGTEFRRLQELHT